MKWISVFIISLSLGSCRRADYECHCQYPDGSHEVFPIGPTHERDAKDDCKHIKEDTGASDCDFVVTP